MSRIGGLGSDDDRVVPAVLSAYDGSFLLTAGVGGSGDRFLSNRLATNTARETKPMPMTIKIEATVAEVDLIRKPMTRPMSAAPTPRKHE